MPDDERQFTGGGEDQPPDHPFYGEAGPSDEDIPASLIFMEMMRRAAAQSTPTTPEVLPSVDLSKFARKPSAPIAPDGDAAAPIPSTSSQQDAPARQTHKATRPLTPAEESQPAPTPTASERPERADRAARREQRRARMEAAQQAAAQQAAAQQAAAPTIPAPLDVPVETPAAPQPKRERERRLSSTGVTLPPTADAAPPAFVAPASPTVEDVSTSAAQPAEIRGVWATPTTWRATYDPPAPPKTPAPRPTSPPEAAPPSETLPPAAKEEVEQERLHEIQRVQRRKRRAAARRRTAVGTMGGVMRTVVLILVSASIMATIFTWVTSPDLLATNVRQNLSIAAATATSGAAPIVPTALVTPAWAMRVGIVSGHWGPENDPGAVCPDGLTEASINRDVAQKVVVALRGRGYQVDLLDEFDPRLENYQATALLSIHTNDCRDYGEYVSGYLIAKAAARPDGSDDARLVECIALHYGQTSGLGRRMGLTVDMTDYHTFREIHPLTPAAILELGFMKDDRAILTEQRDLLAQGIVDGLICYLEGVVVPVNAGTPAVLPTMPSPLPPP